MAANARLPWRRRGPTLRMSGGRRHPVRPMPRRLADDARRHRADRQDRRYANRDAGPAFIDSDDVRLRPSPFALGLIDQARSAFGSISPKSGQ